MRNLWERFKVNKLGTITVTLSLVFVFIGLPSQIISIWQTQSVKEISITTFLLLALQSCFWVMYGFQKKDWVVIIPNFFGTLFVGVIVVEWFMFY